MSLYIVGWVIEIDADTPEDAAKQALEIQRDPDSIATFFSVKDTNTGKIVGVNFEAEE